MELKKLLANLTIKEIVGDANVNVEEIKTQSSGISNKSIFICLKGGDFDGHDYAKEAINYGAIVVVTEKRLNVKAVQVIVADTREAYAIISANFYGNAHKKLKIIGVTGTNGKTSTTHLITSILSESGVKCGLIGTLGIYYGNVYKETNLTTPDPLEFHKILNDMLSYGVEVVVMEVSAHATYYKKLFGVNFEVLAFTNLSQDHLDFFKTMEFYEKEKIKIFDSKCKFIVSNLDDEVGKKICDKYKNSVSYGIKSPADVFAIDVKARSSGSSFTLNLFDKIYDINLSILGLFNVYNALCAVTVCALIGVALDKCAEGIENLKGISGRLECVYDKSFKVFIDYAHTPDGLIKSLHAVSKKCKGKVFCVFGCGGNRDKLKRNIMGKIAGENADFVVVTSDNPRFEEPMGIIMEIEKGLKETKTDYVLIEDRKEAIRYTINKAKTNDVIIICGKGSENYQEIFGIKRLYNDKDTVCEIIKEINAI